MAKSDVNPAQITDLANRKSNLHKESNILGQTVEIHRSNIFYKPRNKWQIGKKSRIFNVTWVQNSAPMCFFDLFTAKISNYHHNEAVAAL